MQYSPCPVKEAFKKDILDTCKEEDIEECDIITKNADTCFELQKKAKSCKKNNSKKKDCDTIIRESKDCDVNTKETKTCSKLFTNCCSKKNINKCSKKNDKFKDSSKKLCGNLVQYCPCKYCDKKKKSCWKCDSKRKIKKNELLPNIIKKKNKLVDKQENKSKDDTRDISKKKIEVTK